jgi:hypothetical protein
VRENVMPGLSEPTLASRSAFSLTRAPSVAELLRRARACRTGAPACVSRWRPEGRDDLSFDQSDASHWPVTDVVALVNWAYYGSVD